MWNSSKTRIPGRLCLLVVAAWTCGCSHLALFALRGEPLVEASAKNPVVEVMCLWEPAEGQGLDGLPARGFAGQVLFFTPGSPQPVKVDGDILIYVFDDQGSREEQGRPIHQFTFDSACWNAFLQKSNIGATYQLFIPYTRSGSFQANCTLRVRYAPREGGNPIYSKMAPVALAGRKSAESSKQLQPEGNPVPSSAMSPTARTGSASVLDLPPAMSLKLQQQLAELHTAAATASRRHAEPAELPVQVESAAPLNGASAPERRTYRLAPGEPAAP